MESGTLVRKKDVEKARARKERLRDGEVESERRNRVLKGEDFRRGGGERERTNLRDDLGGKAVVGDGGGVGFVAREIVASLGSLEMSTHAGGGGRGRGHEGPWGGVGGDQRWRGMTDGRKEGRKEGK